MSPAVVERVREAIARLAKSMSQTDTQALTNEPPKSSTQSAASHVANGALNSSTPTGPGSDHGMLALNGFFHLSPAPPTAAAATQLSPPRATAGVASAAEAQEAVVRLMQASLVAAAERVLPQLPSLDLQSAIVPTMQELDLGSCREPPRTKPPVPPDEVRSQRASRQPGCRSIALHAPGSRPQPVPGLTSVVQTVSGAHAPPSAPVWGRSSVQSAERLCNACTMLAVVSTGERLPCCCRRSTRTCQSS